MSAYGATLAVVAFASSAPAVTRLSLTHDLRPLDLVLLRCGIGGLVFLPFLLLHWRRLPRRLAVTGLALAFFHGWGMHLTAIAGLQFSPASHASALGPGLLPVWVMLWRRIGYGAAPGRLQTIGLALTTIGSLVLLSYSSWSSIDSKVWIGDLLFLLSSGLAAVYLVYVQQHEVEPAQATALVAVYSGVAGGLLLLAWPAPSTLWTASSTEVLAQAAFQGLGMGAGVVFLASYATRELGSQRFSVFIAAIPVLSLLFARTIAGDSTQTHEVLAATLVSSGIFIAGVWAGGSAEKPASLSRNHHISP
ncbi:DMT family transporter [Hydrogenophaga sp. YM1]|uniref:DMT family transporter n=1 Tax=Hydrogenophaga sp. YM1 TaxID=2806262 RepID=UPI00195B970A|nr:DMT family transporter [Hydrogenophaga sp. YM1]QRR33815.1 DMT family transporter [Hydrogenophaga sp. YM1]